MLATSMLRDQGQRCAHVGSEAKVPSARAPASKGSHLSSAVPPHGRADGNRPAQPPQICGGRLPDTGTHDQAQSAPQHSQRKLKQPFPTCSHQVATLSAKTTRTCLLSGRVGGQFVWPCATGFEAGMPDCAENFALFSSAPLERLRNSYLGPCFGDWIASVASCFAVAMCARGACSRQAC